MKTLTFCLALIASSCTLASGQTYKVLYSFQGNTIGDGAQPAGGCSPIRREIYTAPPNTEEILRPLFVSALQDVAQFLSYRQLRAAAGLKKFSTVFVR